MSGGLEVRTRAGQWIEAPVVPGAFIVNIGDCLMRWTNDVYVSTPHRVVNRSARERYSIAFFYDPNPDAMVETIRSCMGEGEVVRYPPILAADYLTDAPGCEQAGGGRAGERLMFPLPPRARSLAWRSREQQGDLGLNTV